MSTLRETLLRDRRAEIAWEDEDVVVVLTPRISEDDGTIYLLGFTVHAIAAWERDGTFLYQRRDALFSPDLVANLEEAEFTCKGFIKWDGDCVVDFPPEGIRLDGRRHAQRLGTVLTRLYDVMAELVPEHAEHLR